MNVPIHNAELSALVVPARGIGDGLLMLIASQQLLKEGYHVTTCHPALQELKEWFPGHHFVETLPQELNSFDLILVENDNSPKMHTWKAEFPQACIFYPSYSPQKNPPLTSQDAVFHSDQTMADNIAQSIATLLHTYPSKDNGIQPPSHFIHRRFPKRIAIHPTSSAMEKNWPKHRYEKLKIYLTKRGFDPHFVMSPLEKENWEGEALSFGTLSELASFCYESGALIGNDSLLGHLASNLNIPTLILANDAKRMKLWKPGWYPGKVLCPYGWIPNSKFLRFRNKNWKCLIFKKRILKTLNKLI